jgi:hypothetical protein
MSTTANLAERLRDLEIKIEGLAQEVHQFVLLFEARLSGPLAPPHDWESEKIRCNPRDWQGPSFKGAELRDAPPEFLDLYAETMSYFAEQERQKNELYKGKPVWTRTDRSARRARRWALRKRLGWQPEAPAIDAGGGGLGGASAFDAGGGLGVEPGDADDADRPL